MGTLSAKAKIAASLAGAVAVAWLAWHASTPLVPVSLLFPAIAMNQPRRLGATGVTVLYYAVASLPVLQISSGYFARSGIRVGVVPWAIATVVLSIPWIASWGPDRDQLAWRLSAAPRSSDD